MLVKIIAFGFAPDVWREIYLVLRSSLPEQPFSVGLFSSREEVSFLQNEFFPQQWRLESPDFLICESGGEGLPEERLAFLASVQSLKKARPPTMALVLESMERGLKQLLEKFKTLTLFLDTGNKLIVTDGSLLLRSFPAKFPRVRVNDYLTHLRLVRPGLGPEGGPEEVRVQNLANGTVLGFGEIEACLDAGGAVRPKEWLRNVLRREGIKRLPHAAGLIRESKGLFLFPGIPLENVRGITVGKVRFAHLLDLERLSEETPQLAGLTRALRKTGKIQADNHGRATALIREAEAKADIPVVCGGGNALLSESLAILLARQGHLRCFTLNAPGEGLFREPSLLIQLSPWGKGSLGVQADKPHLLDITDKLANKLKPLDTLLPWRELAIREPPAEIPSLSREEFDRQRKRLAGRARRARQGLNLEEKRNLLVKQDLQVLEAALKKLSLLLEAEEAIRIWDGSLPDSVQQVLIFSHDQEEAGAVLQALQGIAKKRWFDLSPFTEPDTIQNLNLEEVNHYGKKGTMLMTASSRERLQTLRNRIEEDVPGAEEAVTASDATLEGHGKESQSVERAKQKLAREWIWETLEGWLEENRETIALALAVLRERHERRWLNRSQVHRALIFPSVTENGPLLLEACSQIYPGFNRKLSTVIPYEFQLLKELPGEEALALKKEGTARGLSSKAMEEREQELLRRRNEALFADFLQVVTAELAGLRMDLVLIEHQPEIATRILDNIRRALPLLKNTPAILVLSEYWAPKPGKALPWQHTRVVLLRRLGPIVPKECAQHVRALYPM